MEKKNLFSPAAVLNLLLAAAAAVANAFVIVKSPDDDARFYALVTMVALLANLVYVVNGAGKEKARFYKAIAILFALSELTLVTDGLTKGGSVPFVAVDIVSLALILFLALARDLGKTRSLALCGAVAVLKLVDAIFRAPVLWTAGDLGGLRSLVELALALVFGFCTWLKYQDKARRGTK